jgi:hypothetical protein
MDAASGRAIGAADGAYQLFAILLWTTNGLRYI